jgi:hypothetical protein
MRIRSRHCHGSDHLRSTWRKRGATDHHGSKQSGWPRITRINAAWLATDHHGSKQSGWLRITRIQRSLVGHGSSRIEAIWLATDYTDRSSGLSTDHTGIEASGWPDPTGQSVKARTRSDSRAIARYYAMSFCFASAKLSRNVCIGFCRSTGGPGAAAGSCTRRRRHRGQPAAVSSCS